MTFSTVRRVEFRDTDAAGIVHFSAFFPMMEAAEHEMLRSLGMSVLPTHGQQEGGLPPVTWPRVAASCNYVAAARFEDLLRIDINVANMGDSSVQYRFRFSRDRQLIAEGTMTVVCCYLSHGHSGADPEASRQMGGLTKTPIPDAIRELLSTHQ